MSREQKDIDEDNRKPVRDTQDWDTVVYSKLWLHSFFIGIPCCLAAFLSDAVPPLQGIPKDYFALAYVVLMMIDCLILVWWHRK